MHKCKCLSSHKTSKFFCNTTNVFSFITDIGWKKCDIATHFNLPLVSTEMQQCDYCESNCEDCESKSSEKSSVSELNFSTTHSLWYCELFIYSQHDLNNFFFKLNSIQLHSIVIFCFVLHVYFEMRDDKQLRVCLPIKHFYLTLSKISPFTRIHD